MRFLFLISIVFISGVSLSQKTEQEITQLRSEHLSELLDTTNSILTQEERIHFIGLDYYPVDENFQLIGTFTKSKGKKFKMPTSTERTPKYRRYGYIDFTFNGEVQRLTVYQNISLSKKPGFTDYLFLPFRDLTSKTSTYGGGRYLDIKIPEGSEILLDFNLAYNPYCAYSIRYSCPIPPPENTLEISIEAGEKYSGSH